MTIFESKENTAPCVCFITAVCLSVCVLDYSRTYYKAVCVGGGGEWRTCAIIEIQM